VFKLFAEVMVQFEFKSNLDLGRHPERSRFSGGVKDLARTATVFMTQTASLPFAPMPLTVRAETPIL
jgi:hypothetical protein